jgi:hypothetical protein
MPARHPSNQFVKKLQSLPSLKRSIILTSRIRMSPRSVSNNSAPLCDSFLSDNSNRLKLFFSNLILLKNSGIIIFCQVDWNRLHLGAASVSVTASGKYLINSMR